MDFIFITNNKEIASFVDTCGISRIMIDLEIIGKEERQGHLNTVISRHKISDISVIKSALLNSKLLVRINPIHKNSEEEINKVINSGADIVMLPMFKTKEEVQKFISLINKRAKVCLLLETSQALVRIDDILELEGIDEIHIGLNDLHLSMDLTFMFELLSGGIVDYLSEKISSKNIKFGFGGIGRIQEGLLLNPELILSEHIRLGSSQVILSRAFHNDSKSLEELRSNLNLKEEIEKINKMILKLKNSNLMNNKLKLKKVVNKIISK